ncbi:MAG: helix-turn-helix domain-containing protein [Chthoniobacter sp.]|nr:helix-turn-helix domain-containing protein [Chthoniobacter sp.]
MNLEECRVRTALAIIGGKWKPVIIYYLMEGTRRFGELRRDMPDATQKMLTQQLRELERDGVVARKVHQVVPPKVEYSLTPYGRTLRPVMRELCKWGEKRITEINRDANQAP